MILQRSPAKASFAVPKRTGTPGDDLVAWGLAILVSELAGQDVVLRDDGTHFTIDSPATLDTLFERAGNHKPSKMTSLPWLGSTEKKRLPPEDIEWVDRDVLREDHRRLREASRSGAGTPQGGDAPGVVISDERAKRFPLYGALTNPGKQWDGFAGAAETVQRQLLSPAGLQLILTAFGSGDPLDDARVDAALKGLGITKSDARWRNPPGFLYPGLNKGPTMRLRRESGGTIGQPGNADWMMADRGDRSIVELYLAYVGYFTICTMLDSKEGRIVLVPAPGEVRVPAAIAYLDQVVVHFSAQSDYLLAHAALAYGRAALRYWQEFRHARQSRYGGPNLVLRGVHLGVFWKPNANTYSLRNQGFAPLPAWLEGLVRGEGFDAADDTIRNHEGRIANVRGPWRDEKQLSEEQRVALSHYSACLSGDVREWLTAVRAWFPVARDVEPARSIGLWRVDEIRGIIMALDQKSDILRIIEHESFQNITRAIRAATVNAHYARVKRRRGGGAEEQGFDPDYELVTSLSEAADRGSTDFLRALFEFAAHYNDQTMRRNERVQVYHRRPMIRTEDLDQVAAWVSEDRRALVSAALLAYGTSRSPNRDGEEPAGEVPDEVGTNDQLADREDPREHDG